VPGQGRVMTAFNWTSPPSMELDGQTVQVPQVTLCTYEAAFLQCTIATNSTVDGNCGLATHCNATTVCSNTMQLPSWLRGLAGDAVLAVMHVAVAVGPRLPHEPQVALGIPSTHQA